MERGREGKEGDLSSSSTERERDDNDDTTSSTSSKSDDDDDMTGKLSPRGALRRVLFLQLRQQCPKWKPCNCSKQLNTNSHICGFDTRSLKKP